MISVRTIFIALSCLTIASAFKFKCKFSITFDMYCCRAQYLEVDEPHTKISSVSGTHSPNLTNVHYLYINNQNVKFLPINFAEYFPNLKKITVKNSKLKYITSNDFLGLTQLSTIYMANNNIREIPCGVFDTNQRLEEIHFENNAMNNICADIFNPLPDLKVVNFRNNNCINMDANKTTDIPELLSKIKKSCVVSCDESKSCPALESSFDSKFDKKDLNQLGNTVDKLYSDLDNSDSNLNAAKLKIIKINEEKEKLIQLLKELEMKNKKTIEDANQNEEKLMETIVSKDNKIANTFELECIFSMKTDYSCDVQSLRIDLPHTKITSVSGTHLEDNENEHVKYLGITDQSIKFLPINLAQYFINLKKIQVKNSKLEYITKNDFLGLTQLTHLVMADNIIKELPCGVFDTNRRLQELYFMDNDLHKIGKDIFDPLPLLSDAHFRKNKCVDKDVEYNDDLSELTIEIAKNCVVSCEKSGAYPPLIVSCDSEYFKIIINELGNTVNKLDSDVDDSESNLNYLKEDYEKLDDEKYELNKNLNNIISTKDEYIIKNKELIKDLNASKAENIKINEEKEKLIQLLKELEKKYKKTVEDAKQNEEKLMGTIVSKDNQIVGLETNIQNINNTLETETNWTIRCSNNDQNNCYSKNFPVAVESYYDYTNLKSFYEYKNDTDFRIENSKMTYLSNSFFKHYPMMKYFFVTASQLQSIKNGNFLDAGQLLQITITRNQIRTVEDSTFEGAINVEILNLGSNRIESLSDKALTGMRKLKELNLSNNKIGSLKQGIFEYLPSLESLYMNNNFVTALSGKLFRKNLRLRRVNFNDNKLKNINPQIIQNLNYLYLLNNSCINKEYKELTNNQTVSREIRKLCNINGVKK